MDKQTKNDCSKFIEKNTDIDTWLSIRSYKQNKSVYSDEKFKYYSEIKIKTKTAEELELILKHFQVNHIKTELVIDDVYHSTNLTGIREKRFIHSTSLKTKKNQYKYKSYYEVFKIK